MKILEVKDGFIKFEANASLYLSSFISVSENDKQYIAQVLQLKFISGKFIAIAKLLYLYDGSIIEYDKTTPSEKATIEELDFNIIKNSISANNPIIVGKTADKSHNIIIDSSAFDKKMLVSIDNKENCNTLLENLTKQFKHIGKRTVIIDTLGCIKSKKAVAAVDFKLPLDTKTLSFMYKDCLNDVTSESKALIIDIFKDLEEYSKTVKYLPFMVLKNIVCDMVDNSHVFKLLVFKNKLAKFDKLGYFANDAGEVNAIEKLLSSEDIVIDLSKLDPLFLNRYLSYIFEKLENISNIQVFVTVSNYVNKSNLKEILTSDNVSTTFITHSKFKYLNDIKNIFDNYIISPSFDNNKIFSLYGTLLKALSTNAVVIAGKALNYISLASSIEKIDEYIDISSCSNIQTETPEEEIKTENKDDDSEFYVYEDDEPKDEIEEAITNKSQEAISNAIQEIDVPENVELFSDENNEVEENPIEKDVAQEVEEIINYETIEPSDENEEFASDEELDEISVSVPIEEKEIDSLDDNNDIVIENDTNTVEENLTESIDEEELQYNEVLNTQTDDISIEETEEIQENIQEDNIPEDVQNSETEYLPISDTNDIEENIVVEDSIDNTNNINETDENFHTEITAETPESILSEVEIPDNINLDLSIQDNVDVSNNNNDAENILEVEEISTNNDDSDFDEIVELDPNNVSEDDIIIDMGEDELSENADEQAVNDVDKVFTTRTEDDILDSDLDFIDELNNDNNITEIEESESAVLEELQEDGTENGQEALELIEQDYNYDENLLEDNNEENQDILETKNSTTPIVPVYDAEIPQEDIVASDPIDQGDTVFHAKYGNGVVEKMIKYGNKTLYSINFENVGRRLLDPTLTEIKKF